MHPNFKLICCVFLSVVSLAASTSLAVAQSGESQNQLKKGFYFLVNEVNRPGEKTDLKGISFEVGYNVAAFEGKHHGVVKSANSKILINEKAELEYATFSAPVVDILLDGGDNVLRDCHMHQALALNYGAKTNCSYPEDDTCDDNGKLVSSGPDAAEFKNIEFSFVKFLNTEKDSGSVGFEIGKTYNRTALVKATIHGVTRMEKAEVIVMPLSPDSVRVKTQKPLEVSLEDYQIVVRKPFPFMGVGSKVDISLNLLLQRSI